MAFCRGVSGVRPPAASYSGSYFEPLFRYDQSFAGDARRKSVSNLQFQPTFNLGRPGRWFLTLYPSPEIRVNFGPAVSG
jgi:hypothetical protein